MAWSFITHFFCLGVHAEVEVATCQTNPILRRWLLVLDGELLEFGERPLVVTQVERTVPNPLVCLFIAVATTALKLQKREKINKTYATFFF